jgi:choline kinase
MGKILSPFFGGLKNYSYICLMKLEDLCEIKTNFPEADFWLDRKGSIDTVGKPIKEFSSERIGIKVIKTDVLLPDYLYYVMEYIRPQLPKYGQ